MNCISPLIKSLVLLAPLSAWAEVSSLEQDFRNPPVQTRPYVWWHWMGSNFSKEGITKDLTAMKEAGIGGATIFNLASAVQESHKPTLNNPWPDQTYRSPKYWEAMKHAAAEAQRLGLEIGLHNTVGYSTTGGPWIDEERNMQNVTSTSVTVDGGKRVETDLPRPDPVVYKGWGNTGKKFEFFREIAVLAVPAEGDVNPAKVIDLSGSFKDGRLTWGAPPGRWQVFRMVSTPTGASPHPVPDELIGKTLEADKMSLEQSQYHWDQVIQPMKQHLGTYLGKSFRHFLIDSYEAGNQNWTPRFREEFKKRKGYDPLPWLLTLSKRTVGNADMSNRFKWDHADVIRALYYENGWLTAVQRMKAVGMNLQFEPYGGPFDTAEGAALADLPMGEFWTGGAGSISSTVVSAARAGGRTVIGAEAFTGPPAISKWTETPAFLKRPADGAFASGANRLILHHWVHQPFDDRYKPGMGMGWWGTHFNRHQTWARDGAAFFHYLGRAQSLLQAGETPSDFVSVGKQSGTSDLASWREFRNGMTVKDGRIVLSSGRTYPFVLISHDGRLLPGDVRKIASLLEMGGTIVCSKPSGSPSLEGYPESDNEVKSSTLWTGEAIRQVGKGRLYTKGDVNAAIRDSNITPSVTVTGASGIQSAVRKTSSEHIFFLANSTTNQASFTASLRITGMRPELWDAKDGSIRLAPVWRKKDDRTEVDLTLDSHESIFVVVRNTQLPAEHVVSISTDSGSGALLEIISARFGSPEGNKWMDVTEKLKSSVTRGQIEIGSVNPRFFGRDPASNIVKVLEIKYREGGENHELTVKENDPLKLGKATPEHGFQIIKTAENGSIELASSDKIEARVLFASGKNASLSIAPDSPIQISGKWKVHLDSPVETPRTLDLPSLASLHTLTDPEVRYFSGTATYRTTFEAPAGNRFQLDLGKVHDLARVTLNGKDLGVIWQPPFAVDVSSAIKPGTNQLEVAVTNTWHNRLVGDEQYPADFEWGEDRGDKGHAMKAYPDWFKSGKARPEAGRKGFVVWYYHRKDTPLIPAGLVGPVQLVPLKTAIASP